ncbi:MAG TPA: PDZ domain-containing protein [Planctomycetota bacterium]|jgi:hypothetical protein|nr:PDZ domain-containing protein [Planctomycetota bacterium]
MKLSGIFAAVGGVLWVAGTGCLAQEERAKTRAPAAVQDPQKLEMDGRLRAYLHALRGEPGRDDLRRRILERVDARIAEAVERLRSEIRSIVEEELAAGAADETGNVRRRGRMAPRSPALPRVGADRPRVGVELAGGDGEEGLTVARVLPESPAADAGLREGDRIVSILGVPVKDREELGAILGTRSPGDRVELGVRRGDGEVAVGVVLGAWAEPEEEGEEEEGDEAMEEDDDQSRMAAALAPMMGEPAPRAAQESTPAPAAGATKITFEDMAVGQPPKGWSFARTGGGPEGKWTVEKDGENAVLKQSSADATDFRFPIAVLDGKEFGDFVLTVRFKALSGEVDQAGGVVFRYANANRYLICRANALEGNFRLYTVIEGKRKQLKSQNVKVSPKEWHTIRVECRGNEVRVSYEGGEPLVAEVEGFGPGKVGVWTKADSVTLFDDLVVEPVAK